MNTIYHTWNHLCKSSKYPLNKYYVCSIYINNKISLNLVPLDHKFIDSNWVRNLNIHTQYPYNTIKETHEYKHTVLY